jgi:N-acetylated-alpha-linked acidic dipeptidase
MFDPHFLIHLAQTKLAARLMFEMFNSELIPFNLNSFASSLREIVNRTKVAYEKDLKRHGITLSAIIHEVHNLTKAARKFEQIKNQTDSKKEPGKIRMLNRRMMAFNKLFISPEPIPNRFDQRNLVLGISQNMKYPDITLAGVSDALLAANTSGRWEIVKRQVSLTLHAITQARRSLEMP